MWIDVYLSYTLFLPEFNETLIFSTDFQKNSQISNFMKICPVEAELLQADGRTDGQTDMMKLIFAFRKFAKAPKNP
jgi:hypothetical protein